MLGSGLYLCDVPAGGRYVYRIVGWKKLSGSLSHCTFIDGSNGHSIGTKCWNCYFAGYESEPLPDDSLYDLRIFSFRR